MTNITPLDFEVTRRDYDGIGTEFAVTRQQAGLDVVQVAQRLRIRREHLFAIEEGRFEDLPAPAYAIGFVRSYAEFLGLDPVSAVEQFKLESSASTARVPLAFPSAEPSERMPKGWLIGMSLVLAAVVFGAWYFSENSDRFAVNDVPPAPFVAPVVEPEVPEPVPQVAVATQPMPAEVEAAPQQSLGGEGDLDPEIGRVLGVVAATESEAAGERDILITAEEAPEQGPIDDIGAESGQTLPDANAEVRELDVAANNREVPVPASDEAVVAISPAVVPTEPDIAEVAPGPPEQILAAVVPAEPSLVPQPAGALQPDPELDPAPPAARVVPPAAPADVAALAGGRDPEVFGAENIGARVVIRALQDSWVQVTGAAGELLLTRILRAGDIYRVPNRDDLLLMTGNAGALEITIDGEVISPLGPIGTVRRNVSLAFDRLRAGTAVAR